MKCTADIRRHKACKSVCSVAMATNGHDQSDVRGKLKHFHLHSTFLELYYSCTISRRDYSIIYVSYLTHV